MADELKVDIFDGEEPGIIQTTDSMFTNSDCLFVEYNDIIRPEQFLILIIALRMEDKFSKFLNLDPVIGLSLASLWEWYLNRKHQNVLEELIRDDMKAISHKSLQSFEKTIISELRKEIDIVPRLNFIDTIQELISQSDEKLVKSIQIWHPFYNDMINDDIGKLFKGRAKFIYGDIEVCLKELEGSNTFVFSDLTKVVCLEELNKLELSSILIPFNLKYNEFLGKLKLDLDYYHKGNLFEINFFNNF